ncbi:hypothetical protein B0H11DRAFT_1919526 [Mycena galericulata]|nr:hypothetical protein B0H11DRAFT_1919526 [Mycena galericulata]
MYWESRSSVSGAPAVLRCVEGSVEGVLVVVVVGVLVVVLVVVHNSPLPLEVETVRGGKAGQPALIRLTRGLFGVPAAGEQPSTYRAGALAPPFSGIRSIQQHRHSLAQQPTDGGVGERTVNGPINVGPRESYEQAIRRGDSEKTKETRKNSLDEPGRRTRIRTSTYTEVVTTCTYMYAGRDLAKSLPCDMPRAHSDGHPALSVTGVHSHKFLPVSLPSESASPTPDPHLRSHNTIHSIPFKTIQFVQNHLRGSNVSIAEPRPRVSLAIYSVLCTVLGNSARRPEMMQQVNSTAPARVTHSALAHPTRTRSWDGNTRTRTYTALLTCCLEPSQREPPLPLIWYHLLQSPLWLVPYNIGAYLVSSASGSFSWTSNPLSPSRRISTGNSGEKDKCSSTTAQNIVTIRKTNQRTIIWLAGF